MIGRFTRLLDWLGLGIVRVSGPSMYPTLADGDYVVFRRSSPRRAIRAGEVCVARHADLGLIVKRGFPNGGAGGYRLSGDSLLSSASEHLGMVSRDAIIGVGVLRVSRSGWLGLSRLPSEVPRGDVETRARD